MYSIEFIYLRNKIEHNELLTQLSNDLSNVNEIKKVCELIKDENFKVCLIFYQSVK